MQANEVNGGILLEQVLSAVSVMDVPIQDQNLFRAKLLLGRPCRHSGIIEETKAHRFLQLGVMPRRSDRAESVAYLTGENLLHGTNDAASRLKCNLKRLGTDNSIFSVKDRQSSAAALLQPFQITGRMDTSQF